MNSESIANKIEATPKKEPLLKCICGRDITYRFDFVELPTGKRQRLTWIEDSVKKEWQEEIYKEGCKCKIETLEQR